MERIADLARSVRHREVELLPYHKMGEHKYEAINMNSTSYEAPSEEKMEELKGLFK